MDKVQEIMKLVEKFSRDAISCGLAKNDGAYDAQEYLGREASVKLEAIESALRALLERKPLGDAQIERENLHELFAAGVRFAENCHNIGA